MKYTAQRNIEEGAQHILIRKFNLLSFNVAMFLTAGLRKKMVQKQQLKRLKHFFKC